MRRFIITGCGRSGTTYISKLFTELGIECSHEKVFPKKITGKKNVINKILLKWFSYVPWENNCIGESAWEAAPFLNYLPKNVIIFHQVRHPLQYIISREAKGIVYFPFRNKYMPNLIIHNFRELDRAPLKVKAEYLANFWVDWNLLVEEKSREYDYIRYKMEEIDVNTIEMMLNKIGVTVGSTDVANVYNSYKDKNIHSGYEKNKSISLRMLSDKTYNKVRDLAQKYGYEMS